MREAKLVLDLLPNGKMRSGLSTTETGQRLCETFGGYTAHPSFGCWRSGGELVPDMSVTFHVGLHNANWPAFRSLAIELAQGQETVYVVSPAGETFILAVARFFEASAIPPAEDAAWFNSEQIKPEELL